MGATALKRSILIVSVVILIGYFLNNYQHPQLANFAQDTNNITAVTDEPRAVTDQGMAKPAEKEIFYGEWIIRSKIASGPVSTYGDENIKKLLGKKIVYNAEWAACDQIICNAPVYKTQTVSKQEFYKGSHVSFESLGIVQQAVPIVRIYTDQAGDFPWYTSEISGHIFLVKDQNTLILIDGGTYFEVIRTK